MILVNVCAHSSQCNCKIRKSNNKPLKLPKFISLSLSSLSLSGLQTKYLKSKTMFRRSLLESTHRAGSYRQATGVHGSGSLRLFHAFSQNSQNSGGISGLTKKSKIERHFESSILGNLGMKLGLVSVAEKVSLPYALTFRNSIHSGKTAEVEEGRTPRSMDYVQELLQDGGSGVNGRTPLYQPQASGFTPRSLNNVQDFLQDGGNGGVNGRTPLYRRQDSGFTPRSLDNIQDFLQDGGNGVNGQTPLHQPQRAGLTPRYMDYGPGFPKERGNDVNGRPQMESNADIVHIKLMRNNAFVTVTDSKGNKKVGISAGKLAGKGGKLTRYAGEAAAEDIGRKVRQMKTRSVVVKVNGFTFFRKKRDAVLSFKEGYTNARGDMNPVVYIEDTTRKPHNGCRLPKKRRI